MATNATEGIEMEKPVNVCMSRNWLREVIEAKTQCQILSPVAGEIITESQFRAWKLLQWIGDMLAAGLDGKRAHLLLREVEDLADLVDELKRNQQPRSDCAPPAPEPPGF